MQGTTDYIEKQEIVGTLGSNFSLVYLLLTEVLILYGQECYDRLDI